MRILLEFVNMNLTASAPFKEMKNKKVSNFYYQTETSVKVR